MARPRKGEEKGATTQIGVRVSPELRAKLDELARHHERSITDEVRAALEAYAAAAGSRRSTERRPSRRADRASRKATG
jgi:predicted transcriptional regulator